MKSKGYPSDCSDAEWEFAAPYLTLMTEQAPQREVSLRQVFKALRYVARSGCSWRLLPNDFPPFYVVYQQMKRWERAQVFEIMGQDLREFLRLAVARKPHPRAVILDARTLPSTPESGGRAGYDGGKRRKGSKLPLAAQEHGIRLEVVKLSEAKRGFVLLPRRWVVERTFGWTARFRRLARDYERLASTLKEMPLVAFASLFLRRFVDLL